MKIIIDGKEFYIIDDVKKWIENINLYEKYSEELFQWAFKNKCKLPKISSVRGQILSLITDIDHYNIVFTRELLNTFLEKIQMKSNDVIQHVNKTDQWGLLHKTYLKKYYYIPRPFEYIDIHIKKRIQFGDTITNAEKLNMIQKTKKFLLKFYINVDDKNWDLGHIDPNGTNSNTNLIMQPPIQRAYRDRFKFDSYGLRVCPTAKELIENITKYYTKNEIDFIRSALLVPVS